MNLRKVGSYNIGLDIGTGSVGWAVTDEDGNLCYFKGKPTWGSRIFPSASTASDARIARGLRRRYNRRRWRLNLLQEMFKDEIEAVDPEFFIRLNQTALMPEDRTGTESDYIFTLFNDKDFNEKDYFKEFPTIYHLRKWLMETDEKADIRLIYLALHNIVKHRGNFLQQDNSDLTSQNANVGQSVRDFCYLLQEYCDELDIPCNAAEVEDELIEILSDTESGRKQLQESIQKVLTIGSNDVIDAKSAKAMLRGISAALIGLSADMAPVFFISEEVPEEAKTKIYLSKDEDVEQFEEICPDAGLPLFEAMKAIYSAYVLQEILSSCPGESISINKVADYVQYGKDLKILKGLVRKYAPEKYDEFFRGPFYEPTALHPQKYVYDRSKAQGYTKYNEVRGWSYTDFAKAVKGLLDSTDAADDPQYLEVKERLDAERFLRRQKTSDNGAIPFQLHLEEMDRIIENQGMHYPFLLQDKDKLDSLVTFRIPYYVGPLTLENAAKDAAGKTRFAWSKRVDGKENEPIKPWNWEEIIDKDRSATEFIQRMTGTCTYIQGEPVLPKNSLLYEEYCVLNELNGAKFSQDGDAWRKFDYRDRTDMVVELFRKGKVSYKKVSDWMRMRGHSNVTVKGGQGETGFESKLGSYIFFSKDIFGVDEIPLSDYPMIEEIILWSTIFEDRSIFKDKLKRNYGDRLTDEQIKKIVRKRFSGWGRLSRRLLNEIKTDTDNGPKTILDILQEGNPNNQELSRPMVFMEIITDDTLGFGKLIDDINKEKMVGVAGLAIDELPGSPALRRSVNQALCIVDEIVHIAGHAPKNIFIEVTREDDMKKKGHRTKRRYDALSAAMNQLKADAPEYWNASVASELADFKSRNRELNDRLALYFMQGGKSLYSEKEIEIDRLFGDKYQVDHILPQSYIKDDSLENKALVLAGENQSKSDQMLLDKDIRNKMKSYWDALLHAGLIGKKKHANLLRDHISDKQMKGFIARQLVETSQIMKIVQGFLDEKYQDTEILPVKAKLSSELRHELGLPKCREANDFHHAHDAFLASEIGRFIQIKHPGIYDNPIGYTAVMKKYIKGESNYVRKGHNPAGSSFIVASFLRPTFDRDTGEILDDDWSSELERIKLKKYFNYRQCYISRMPEETSGAFWDQTIYSPRDTGKNMTLPLKKGMDPAKYGSYSREQFAYFFIYEAVKKSNTVLEFAPVPVSVASRASQFDTALADYAKSLAEESDMEFVKIIRSKIYKYQLIEMQGSRLYLTGKVECRNAVQFAFNMDELASLSLLYKDNEGDSAIGFSISADMLDRIFLNLVESLSKYSPKLFSALSIDAWKDGFFKLDLDSRADVIKSLVAIGNGKANVANLTAVGGAKCAGNLKFTFNNILTKGDGITFIDQSITGMFERRTHIGL